jgi:hypothetical protein
MEDTFISRAIDYSEISVYVITREFGTLCKKAVKFQYLCNWVRCRFWFFILCAVRIYQLWFNTMMFMKIL